MTKVHDIGTGKVLDTATLDVRYRELLPTENDQLGDEEWDFEEEIWVPITKPMGSSIGRLVRRRRSAEVPTIIECACGSTIASNGDPEGVHAWIELHEPHFGRDFSQTPGGTP